MDLPASRAPVTIQSVFSLLSELQSACVQLLQNEKNSETTPIVDSGIRTGISGGALTEVDMHIKYALSIVRRMNEASYPAVSMPSSYAVQNSGFSTTLPSPDALDALIATGISWQTSSRKSEPPRSYDSENRYHEAKACPQESGKKGKISAVGGTFSGTQTAGPSTNAVASLVGVKRKRGLEGEGGAHQFDVYALHLS